jgi:hypothetical protein
VFVLTRFVTTVHRTPGVRPARPWRARAPGMSAPLAYPVRPRPPGTKIGKYFDATSVCQRQHTRTQSARPARVQRVHRTYSVRPARVQRDSLLESCCAAAEQVLSICWAADGQLLITCGATTEELLSIC